MEFIFSRLRRWFWRLARWAVLASVVVGLVAWGFRAQLAEAAARAWIVDEGPTSADAIVVLGGGLDTRPAFAAELYKKGYAPRILLLDPPAPEQVAAGLVSQAEAGSRIIEHHGVARDHLEVIGPGVTSTMEELQALRAWAVEHGAKVLLIPTDAFHTRRVNHWTDTVFGPLGIDVRVLPVEDHRYPALKWWTHETGLISFQNELVKSVYYMLKFS
jgi:uncharacterized SAM-binding protein YcdF (DUF218 family)